MRNTVCIVGGDMRQITVGKLLSADGYKVTVLGFDDSRTISDIKSADVVILPVPVSCDDVNINAPFADKPIAIEEITERISAGTLVLGARFSDNVKEKLESKGIKCVDYLRREELIIKNAIPTAEGALEIALSEMPITLFKSRALVMGYGRVGKVMAEKLHALGAYVSVSARKCEDFAWIEERGMIPVHTSSVSDSIADFDLIINTIPAIVLDEEALGKVRGDALIIDLASKPGGVDFETAKSLGKNVIWALSLPGKSAPITSGKIIKDTIINILSETEV